MRPAGWEGSLTADCEQPPTALSAVSERESWAHIRRDGLMHVQCWCWCGWINLNLACTARRTSRAAINARERRAPPIKGSQLCRIRPNGRKGGAGAPISALPRRAPVRARLQKCSFLCVPLAPVLHFARLRLAGRATFTSFQKHGRSPRTLAMPMPMPMLPMLKPKPAPLSASRPAACFAHS
jgi:hypothetical protein